jgi:putative hydrolase of the HAD superfamily
VYKYASFDLDNTLYSYDENSKYALGCVFDLLVSGQGIDEQRLWNIYLEYIKKIPGPILFSDGRTSYEYRKERFTDILGEFSIRDDDLAEECVSMYSQKILERIKPFPGVVEMFSQLSTHSSFLIITDAPQDVQQKILTVLGIDSYIHKLFTPTSGGKIKQDGGLFLQALGELGAEAKEVIHFGDSYPRDVLGAQIAGIRAVLLDKPKGYFDEVVNAHEGSLEIPDDVSRIQDISQATGFI